MPKANRIDDPAKTYILFLQTSRIVLKFVDAYLHRKLHLSNIKLAVLTVLDASDGIMKPSDIAELTHTERHNITTLVSRMSHEGLIRSVRNSNDKRLVDVIITDKGREIYSQSAPIVREIISKLMLSITEKDFNALEKPLRKIRRNARCGLKMQKHPDLARRRKSKTGQLRQRKSRDTLKKSPDMRQ